MARSFNRVETPKSIDKAFAFISDFRHALLWDSRTVAADKLTDGPIDEGTRFNLVGAVAGLRLDLPYEIEEYQQPGHLVVKGHTWFMSYREQIDFRSKEDGGTEIDYEAKLRLRSFLWPFNPLMSLVYQRLGDQATGGIAEALQTA